jgi:hypothetical protein
MLFGDFLKSVSEEQALENHAHLIVHSSHHLGEQEIVLHDPRGRRVGSQVSIH